MEKLKPKLFSVLKGYSRDQFLKDLVAGAIVTIVALPMSIALAMASGVSPEQGIYTAIVAGFIAAFLGGSRVQISGPTAAFAMIVASIVARNGLDGLMLVTLMAGVILILMGLFRLGNLIRFIPHTITTGFTSGVAVTILIGQLKDFFGVTYAQGERPIETIEKMEAFVRNSSTINIQALFVGLCCLGVLILWPKISRRIPGSIIAILVGVALVKGLNLEVLAIGDLYKISNRLPRLQFPTIRFQTLEGLLPDAFTIAILAAIESLFSCVVSDNMIGSKHRSNMELIAQGAGNIGSALFGGIPAVGALARTTTNIKNGGRTPIAGMVHAVVMLLILVVLMPYASMIPMPAIGAILFMVAYNMSEWREFLYLLKTSPKSDITVLLTTFILTIVFNLVIALEVGMILACLLFIRRMSEETSVEQWRYIDEEDDPERLALKVVPPNTAVYEINGPLFFGAADQILKIPLDKKRNCLVLRMRSVNAIDASAMRMLERFVDRCNAQNTTLILAHVNEQPMAMIQKARLDQKIGPENILSGTDEALKRAEQFATNTVKERL